jgi:DNA-binding NarL/FixJ family response regulator
MFIADDRMALAPLHPGGDVSSAIIVHPSALLDALGALFEGVWQRALPLAAFQENPTGELVLDAQQRRLLQLLASGCTDETTARYLQVGARTVQRQIHALMELFSVRTRFQLGLRAARLVAEVEAADVT